MTSRKIDPSIPNVPYPTPSRGLVLGANGKLQTSTLPDGVMMEGSPALDGKVDKDSVVVAATRIVQSKLLAADAQPAFRILGDGKHSWGAGGSSSPDTVFYRSAAGVLKTDTQILADDTIRSNNKLVSAGGIDLDSANGGWPIRFGTTFDTNLYRTAAGQLKTDTLLMAGGEIGAQAGNAAATWIGGQGPGGASGVKFGNAGDTNLYRTAANILKTDGTIWAVGEVYGSLGVNQVGIGARGPSGQAGVSLGNNNDTILFRNIAGEAKVTGLQLGAGGSGRPSLSMYAGGNYETFSIDVNGKMQWGGGPSPYDTNLYREMAGLLRTDGTLAAGGQIQSNRGLATRVVLTDVGGGQAGITFGSAADTNLYRAGANWLKTDDTFTANYVGFTTGLDPPQFLWENVGNDCNLLKNPGAVYATGVGGGVNFPVGGFNGIVMYFGGSGGAFGFQLGVHYDGQTWIRMHWYGTWYGWRVVA